MAFNPNDEQRKDNRQQLKVFVKQHIFYPEIVGGEHLPSRAKLEIPIGELRTGYFIFSVIQLI